MGRGRAKAKQQKVARDLKYNTHHTDLAALQNELAGVKPSPSPAGGGVPTWDVDDGAADEGDFDEDRWASAR